MSDEESIDDEIPTGIFPGETDAPGGSSAGGISGILGAGAVGGSVKPTKRPRKSRSASSSSRTRPVVKLMVTSVSRSYVEPWRRKTQRERCVLCCLFDVSQLADVYDCMLTVFFYHQLHVKARELAF